MYKDVKDNFKEYWDAYGGWHALFCSPYLHLAFVLLIPTMPIWCQIQWWDQVTNIIPCLLGFTLGGFTLFISFGNEEFRAFLVETPVKDNKHNAYIIMCANFLHFIIVQTVALLYALVTQSLQSYHWPLLDPFSAVLFKLNFLASGIGYAIFLYALTSMFAMTMHIFNTAFIYSDYQEAKRKDNRKGD